MKLSLWRKATVLLALMAVTACSAPKYAGNRSQGASPAENTWPGNAYFFYFAAQKALKEQNLDKARELLGQAILHDTRSTFLKMEFSEFLAERGELSTALEMMRAVSAKDPQHVEALILLGKLEQEQKNRDRAVEAFEKALRLDPGKMNVYLFLGAVFMENEDTDNAERIYGQMAQRFPNHYVGHFFLGRIQGQKGRIPEAEKAFTRVLELEPDLEEARYALIDLHEAQGKTEKAIALFREILGKNPESTRSILGLGRLLHEAGDFQASRQYLKPLGEKSLTDPDIVRQVFNLYLDEKKYDAAVTILTVMLEGAPEASDLHYLMGIAQDGKENKEQAVGHMKKVLPGSRFYTNAVVHTAFLLQETGNTEKAIAFLEGVARQLPENADIYLYLGSFYEEVEQFEKAEKTLKQGLETDPGNARILFRLGVVYDKFNRKEDSIRAMREVVRIDPKNANALNYLGYTLAELGKNLDEAEKLILEAMKHKPNDGYITDSLGWVYYKKGRIQEALEWIQKAIGLVPEDPIILEHLGDVYLKMEDRENALRYYRKSLDLRKKDKSEVEIKINNILIFKDKND